MGDWLRRLRYNRQAQLAALAVVLLIGAVGVWFGIYYVMQHDVVAIPLTVTDGITPTSTISLTARLLDGMLVQSSEAAHQPIGVMIENAAFDGVRPQFGLGTAQVVYEVIVEGGITRFLALYSGDLPEKIGPVRSARPTYLEFVSEYDALYAHAGGSPEAMQAIAGLQLKDLSALGSDSRFFFRDNARVAPHNLFTSAELLQFALRDKKLQAPITEFDSWQFTEDAKPVTSPVEEKYIDIDFGSGPLYQVHYRYNYAANNYERYNGGELQVDAATNQTISVRNIIVQIVPPGIAAGDNGRINFSVTGTGTVYVANNGQVIEGSWQKKDRLSRTVLYNNDGEPINLVAGNSWIAIVPDTVGLVSFN
ncbi:MAG: DUF3048 domain-containing protein [Candidatus Kerfeldbacteria bacterium]|nr:DUF3048 domain-containing protein [Candidatus Kerfeldbacteria bacterium]